MAQTIESYLVGLGFSVDQSGLQKFNQSLAQVGKTVATTVGNNSKGVIGDLFKMQFAITSAFAAVGVGAVGLVDKIAMFDQSMRLGALSAFMSKNGYQSMNVALQALGATIDQVAWDPELHARFLQLQQDQKAMMFGLGPDFEANMKNIRDLRFEWSRFTVELQYLSMGVVNDLFTKLGFGSGDLLSKFKRFNDYVIANLPHISDVIATDVVPVLKTLWRTLEDIGEVAKDAFLIFQNAVAIITGDDALKGTTLTFDSFAKTLEHVVNGVDALANAFLDLETAVLKLDFSKITGQDLGLLGGAALLTGTGRGLLGRGIGAVLGGGGAEAAAGGAALPLAAVAAGGVGVWALLQRREQIDAWMLNHFGFTGDVAGHGVPTASLNLPPGLVDAVKWNESRGHQFDKNGNVLRSSAGALGEMQLMPGTAAALGVDPMNEADNVRGGTMYLQQLFAKYHDVDKTLAAYNLGPGALDRLVRAHGASYLDYAPRETRDYVRNADARMAGAGAPGAGDITINVQVATNANPDDIGRAVASHVRVIQQQQNVSAQANVTGVHQ
jgi:Transglycosylase SLT domain